MSAQFGCGQIIWAEIFDPNGFRKGRPAIIITQDDQIVAPGIVEVVAITSTLRNPLPDDCVLLPWHAQKHPRTGLNRRSAAVCSWVLTISTDEIFRVIDTVPGPHFHRNRCKNSRKRVALNRSSKTPACGFAHKAVPGARNRKRCQQILFVPFFSSQSPIARL